MKLTHFLISKVADILFSLFQLFFFNRCLTQTFSLIYMQCKVKKNILPDVQNNKSAQHTGNTIQQDIDDTVIQMCLLGRYWKFIFKELEPRSVEIGLISDLDIITRK